MVNDCILLLSKALYKVFAAHSPIHPFSHSAIQPFTHTLTHRWQQATTWVHYDMWTGGVGDQTVIFCHFEIGIHYINVCYGFIQIGQDHCRKSHNAHTIFGTQWKEGAVAPQDSVGSKSLLIRTVHTVCILLSPVKTSMHFLINFIIYQGILFLYFSPSINIL